MKTVSYLLWLFFGLFVHEVSSKMFTRCGLTEELASQGFDRCFVGHWTCLIESESGRNSNKRISRANRSQSLGLFQISSREWCTFNRPGGKCNMKCEDLLNDDIADDARCAKKIYSERGFEEWRAWKRSCYRRELPMRIARNCSRFSKTRNVYRKMCNATDM